MTHIVIRFKAEKAEFTILSKGDQRMQAILFAAKVNPVSAECFLHMTSFGIEIANSCWRPKTWEVYVIKPPLSQACFESLFGKASLSANWILADIYEKLDVVLPKERNQRAEFVMLIANRKKNVAISETQGFRNALWQMSSPQHLEE